MSTPDSSSGVLPSVDVPPPVATNDAAPPPAPLNDYQRLVQSLPDDLRGSPELAKAPDFATLVKNHVNAQALLGRKGVLLPAKGPESDPDGWAAVWDAVGRPPAPDKYELPAESGLEPDFETEVRGLFHQLGVSQRQAASFVEWYASKAKAAQEAEAGELKAAQAAQAEMLTKTYGTAAAVDAAKATASRVMAMFAPQEMKADFDTWPLAHDAHTVVLLNEIGRRLAEDKMIGSATGAATPAVTKDTAEREIGQLSQNRDFSRSIMDRQHPDHAKNLARWQELHKAAAGTDVVSADQLQAGYVIR